MLTIGLHVTTNPNTGTTFQLQIPVAVNPEQVGDVSQPESQKTMSDIVEYHTVVVIDDNELSLSLIEAVFEGEGYTVYTAKSAQEGIEIIKKTVPDVILMDLAMPDINGIEATKMLKQNPETAHIPVIGCSAFATKEFKDQAYQAGCIGYITKPVEPHRLIEQVRKSLQTSKSS